MMGGGRKKDRVYCEYRGFSIVTDVSHSPRFLGYMPAPREKGGEREEKKKKKEGCHVLAGYQTFAALPVLIGGAEN